jgi:hypothetical protein
MRQARLARILSVLFLMMMQPASQPKSDIAERDELVNAKWIIDSIVGYLWPWMEKEEGHRVLSR